ncbi:cell division protein FtsL [Desulfitibacter alkalitolerans]|uniref:cell division protein FtsL n=1 Tax=Desulfitibacter alkalitolerans TaxID=264641 RepID=UPI0004894022|nr:cell division protein FtsL [Desulfitibacter alkalitolerans]
MIVAPKIREYTTVETLEVNRENKEHKKAKLIKSSTKVKLVMCSLTLISFIMGLALTSLAAHVSAKGQELNTIKRELNSLQINNERLQLEKTRLLALENIETIAITELGMEKPQFENLKMVTVEEISTADALLALHKPSENRGMNMEDNNSSVSLMTAIANVFSGWAVTGKH